MSALASAREMDLVAQVRPRLRTSASLRPKPQRCLDAGRVRQWTFSQHLEEPCAALEETLGVGCVKVSGVVEPRCWVRSQIHASLAARFCLFRLGAAGRWQVLLASAVAMGALRLALEALR